MLILCLLLLQYIVAEITVFESVYPSNELQHVVHPNHGDIVASFKNISHCYEIAKSGKSVSYYNQDLTSSINGISSFINAPVTCVVSISGWPLTRVSSIYKTTHQLGLSEPLGGGTFHVNTYKTLEMSFNDKSNDMPDGYHKFTYSRLSNKRIRDTNNEIIFQGSSLRLLECIDKCYNNTECHHVEIFKGNIHDDTMVNCKLYKRENLVYETTQNNNYIHIKRQFDYNLVDIFHPTTSYINDPRTIGMIVCIVFFGFLGTLSLWVCYEKKVIIL